MTGENFIRLNRNQDIKRIKAKILELKEECGKLYQESRYGDVPFNSEKHDRLCKQIEWQEYLLWGLTK